ncbi:MAG: DUF4113 domain-containing protein [Porticoccaceae bacterium]|nr:DUF4113 domain-containing protein [Porticoccaceae bacterium]
MAEGRKGSAMRRIMTSPGYLSRWREIPRIGLVGSWFFVGT